MAYKVFTAGEEALASDVNSLLMSQTVARFATAAARSTAGTGIVAPVLNQLSVLDSRPGVVQSWNGSAWVDLAPFIQTGFSGGTTNGSGIITTTFPVPFAVAPTVSLSITGSSIGIVCHFIIGTTTTNFQAQFFFTNTVNTANNGVINSVYIAVGQK